MKMYCLGFAVFLSLVAGLNAADLYVSPAGGSGDPGKEEKRFMTLQQALKSIALTKAAEKNR